MGEDTESEPDATQIRSVAVHREDIANALEATLRSDRTVVLRVTPPFSGRMRARLHSVDTGVGSSEERERGEQSNDTMDRSGDGTIRPAGPGGPIHLAPTDLITEHPDYPAVDDTTAELPDADVETRRERHAAAVEAWRETVRERVGGRVSVPVADGTHDIEVVGLG